MAVLKLGHNPARQELPSSKHQIKNNAVSACRYAIFEFPATAHAGIAGLVAKTKPHPGDALCGSKCGLAENGCNTGPYITGQIMVRVTTGSVVEAN